MRTLKSAMGLAYTLVTAWVITGCIVQPVASVETPSAPAVTAPSGELASPTPTLPPTPTMTIERPFPTPTWSATRTPTPYATEASVRLEVWECLSPEPSEVLHQEAVAFQERHPGTTLAIRHCEDASTWPEQLASGAIAGWHVLLGDATLLAALQQHALLQPLEDLLARHELATLATPARVAATRDRSLWGLADTLGFHLLLYYRHDLVVVPPADVSALNALARSHTSPPERWGLVVNSYDPLWVIPWLGTCGEWLTDVRGRLTLDTAAMVRALDMYRNWHHPRRGIAPVTTHHEARQMFLEGQAAMLLDGDWALRELAQVPTLDWAVATLPMVEAPGCAATPLMAGRFWMVHRDLPLAVQHAAADWLRYVFAPERQVRWALRFNTLPTHRAALRDVRLLEHPYLRASVQQMQTGRALPLGVDANAVLGAMRTPLRALLDGNMTPAEAARAMQQNAARIHYATDTLSP